MKPLGELALVLCCASLGALGTWALVGSPSREIPCDPALIAPEEICLVTVQAEWPEGGFLWIDARSEQEWRENGIAGSIHLTTVGGGGFDEQLEANLDRLSTAPRVLIYCGSAGCGVSKEVAKRLDEYGLIPESKALHGGWDALRQAGLVKDSNPAN